MKKYLLVAIFVSLFVTSGCMTARFSVSEPQVSKLEGIKKGPNGRFNIDGINISLKPYNFAHDASVLCLGLKVPKRFDQFSKAFYVEVGLMSKAQGVEFDPANIVLNIKNEQLKPEEIYGPTYKREVYTGGLFFFEDFGKAFLNGKTDELSIFNGSLSLEPKKWVGVLLKFNTYPPTVDNQFSLSVTGLTKDGSSVEISDINFAKGIVGIVDDL